MIYLYNITTNRQKEALDLKEKKVSVYRIVWREEREGEIDGIIIEIILRNIFLSRTSQWLFLILGMITNLNVNFLLLSFLLFIFWTNIFYWMMMHSSLDGYEFTFHYIFAMLGFWVVFPFKSCMCVQSLSSELVCLFPSWSMTSSWLESKVELRCSTKVL